MLGELLTGVHAPSSRLATMASTTRISRESAEVRSRDIRIVFMARNIAISVLQDNTAIIGSDMQ